MRLSRTLVAAAAMGALLLVPTAAEAQITNSLHDMSFQSTTAGPKASAAADDQICIFCHTPHSALESRAIWNHSPTALTHTWSDETVTYAGTPLPADLSPSSKRCLSCHDGSVSLGDVNNIGGGASGTIATTPATMPAAYQVGASGDMLGTHPVSIPYAGEAGSSATAGGALGAYYDASNAACTSPSGVCTTDEPLINLIGTLGTSTVECATCHEPHNSYSNTYFLRVSITGSELCLSCHNK